MVVKHGRHDLAACPIVTPLWCDSKNTRAVPSCSRISSIQRPAFPVEDPSRAQGQRTGEGLPQESAELVSLAHYSQWLPGIEHGLSDDAKVKKRISELLFSTNRLISAVLAIVDLHCKTG